MEQNFKCPLCSAYFEKQDELKEHLGEYHLDSEIVLELGAAHPDKPDSVPLVTPIPVIIRTEPTPTSEFPADANGGCCGCFSGPGERTSGVVDSPSNGCQECCGDCWQCCNICDDCQCVVM